MNHAGTSTTGARRDGVAAVTRGRAADVVRAMIDQRSVPRVDGSVD